MTRCRSRRCCRCFLEVAGACLPGAAVSELAASDPPRSPMFRAGILASFVVVALAFDPGRVHAQVIASAGPLSNADRGIAAPIVRITSRRLPFEGRDLLLVNCAWAEQDFVGMVTAAFPPYGCVRHMSGTLERMDADSIVIVRNG